MVNVHNLMVYRFGFAQCLGLGSAKRSSHRYTEHHAHTERPILTDRRLHTDTPIHGYTPNAVYLGFGVGSGLV